MNELTHYSNYAAYKQALDTEMLRTAEGFVRIGYLLKYAQETNIIQEGGYETVNEFAKAEYGIDASQVSRFINIHERFGVPGEARLQDHYINHGVAKLGIMLTLPDTINEEISSAYSKEEIKQIKADVDAEQQISDIEVMCEEKNPVLQSLPEGLERVMYQLIHEQPTLYQRMYKTITLEDLKETLAPSGECAYSIRIPGTGRMMVIVKSNEKVVVINVRTGEKESYEWQQLFDALKEHVAMGDTAKESWQNVFKEPFPEEEKKEEIAPVQQKKENKAVKKESKVKTAETKTQTKPAPKPVEPKKEPEEQLPGQDSIMDHPEYLPDDMKAETSDKVEHIAPVQSDVGTEHAIRGLKSAITATLHAMYNLAEKEDWDMIISKAMDLVWRAKKIKELEEKN